MITILLSYFSDKLKKSLIMENIEVKEIVLQQSSNSVSLLSELHKNRMNTDLNFFSDGRTVSFHSVILRQSSDFLSQLLDSSEKKPDHSPRILSSSP